MISSLFLSYINPELVWQNQKSFAMKTLIITILSVVLLGTVRSTQVQECTRTNAPRPEVEISECVQGPCVAYIGSKEVMTMKFKAPRHLENIAPKVEAILAGVTLLYPLDQEDACDGVANAACPLEEGDDVEYTYELDILSLFPPISIDVEFSLVDNDNDGEAFTCFRIQLELKKE